MSRRSLTGYTAGHNVPPSQPHTSDADRALACLAAIAELLANELPVHELARAIAERLPNAWRHADVCAARVVIDGISFLSPAFAEPIHRLSSPMVVGGKARGTIEVGYCQERPVRDHGPFSSDEQILLAAVANLLALAVGRHKSEEERADLESQLRHADRLATIGQLSAGVAHELNEPLAAILGFAQLARKQPAVPVRVGQDLDKIITASLHGREVVQKLMLFAHQTPPEKSWVNLNGIARDGLYFLESRCAKASIELIRDLEPDLPEIHADPGQMYQVMVNLTVNAIQAMPSGGRLTITTAMRAEEVVLAVTDTGSGMTDEVRAQVFVPFFTTKEVGEGTGLGLAVVDGIIKSHGGRVVVDSAIHIGTTFTVHLPAARQ